MKKLTRKQADVLEFINKCIDVMGFAPSITQVSEGFSVSRNAVVGHIDALKKKGAITWTEGKKRSVRPVKGFKVVLKGDK